MALGTLMFLAKYDKKAPTFRSSWSSLYAAWNMRHFADDSNDFWHVNRSAAHLLHMAAYVDAFCVASRKVDDVGALTERLGFTSTLDMVS